MLRALLLNCTLKKSPEVSNTDGLLGRVAEELRTLGCHTETLRPVDYNIAPGTASDMGDGDEWPLLLDKIKACNILIIGSPVWVGHLGSVAQRVIERLDAVFHEEQLWEKETGQYFTYNKVGGAVVTGNEDGAHACVAHILFALSEFGFTIPPNCNAYWVGPAGPGPSYLEADGLHYEYSNKIALFTAHNVYYFAKLLQENPIPTRLKDLYGRAREMSGGQSDSTDSGSGGKP